MSSTQARAHEASRERVDGNTSQIPRMPQMPQAVKARRRPLLRLGTRLFNPLVRRLAGSRYLRLFAVIQHRGRRSGRMYATPVVARRTADGFVIPMTFGEGADWFRNVQAAGGCVIRWNGADYPVVAPEVIDWAAARPAFSRLLRMLVPLLGIERFVRLRHAPAGGNDAKVERD